jgi:NAD+ diphosphatase
MARVFMPGVEALGAPGDNALWFLFQGSRMLTRAAGPATEVPRGSNLDAAGLAPLHVHYLGALDGQSCYTGEIDSAVPLPDGLAADALRPLAARLDADFFALAGRAIQVVEWDRTHQYCERCATPTEPVAGERAKRCPACGLVNYPRISPAIIVLVRRGDTMLLAHSANFPAAFYSTLAGFVEPGETLEECVAREIREEVGIEVADIRYFGSQPWPFPHSLMIGFTATHAGGEIQVDGREIADAGWFTPANLPLLPPPFSIARRLIDAFLAEHQA